MTTEPTAAIIQAVEANLRAMFEKGVVVDFPADDLADGYLAKARATTDPELAAGYRRLAEQARLVGS